MRSIRKSVAWGVAGLSLMTSSAGLSAVQTFPVAAQQPQNPWMTLSMMTPVAATSLDAAGVTVQPPPEATAPLPPPDGRGRAGIEHMPIPVLAIWLGTIVAMIYIAAHDDKDRVQTKSPD